VAVTVTNRTGYGPGVNVNARHLDDLCAGDRPALVAALAGRPDREEEIAAAVAAIESVSRDRDHFVATGHRLGALIQSYLGELTVEHPDSFVDPNGLLQPSFTVADLQLVRRFPTWLSDVPAPAPETWNDDRAVRVADTITVALFGDWATGSPASRRVSAGVAGTRPDAVIHLGDVYFAGTAWETQRYLLGDWPRVDGAVERACNSNHEMYAGGAAYRNLTLPFLSQNNPYFVLENNFWLMIGLDTGTVDSRLTARQVSALKDVAGSADQRRIVLFSHHPLLSWDTGVNRDLAKDTAAVLETGRVAAWYSAHDHAFVRFDRDEYSDTRVRCVGHGGFPYLTVNTTGRVLDRSDSYALVETQQLPGLPRGAALTGPSGLATNAEMYGPMGWLRLTFDGPELVEHLIDLEGMARFEFVVHGAPGRKS
jgi:hypothetical protein